MRQAVELCRDGSGGRDMGSRLGDWLAGCQSLSEGEEMVEEGGDYWRDTKEVIGSDCEILDET